MGDGRAAPSASTSAGVAGKQPGRAAVASAAAEAGGGAVRASRAVAGEEDEEREVESDDTGM